MSEGGLKHGDKSPKIDQSEIDRLVNSVTTRDTNSVGALTASIENLLDFPEVFSFLKQFFAGRPVVDLACGDSHNIESFVKKLGAIKYTGVDKYVTFGPELKRQVDAEGFISERLQQDMLAYISSLPSESANVIMVAVDESIVPQYGVGADYIKALIDSMARVVPKGGVVIGQVSPFLKQLTKRGFLQIQLPGQDPQTHPELRLQIFLKQ